MYQADQICYSVLCVFSYVAAGQEQKKNFPGIKVREKQKSPISPAQVAATQSGT